VNGLIIGGEYSGNHVFEEQQTPVLSKYRRYCCWETYGTYGYRIQWAHKV
jgi:hypothetical protein